MAGKPTESSIPSADQLLQRRAIDAREPDPNTAGQVRWLEEERQHDRLMRRQLVPFVLRTVRGWMILVALLLLLDGFQVFGFDLADSVLIAAIGASAIFGLLSIILRHYFRGTD